MDVIRTCLLSGLCGPSPIKTQPWLHLTIVSLTVGLRSEIQYSNAHTLPSVLETSNTAKSPLSLPQPSSPPFLIPQCTVLSEPSRRMLRAIISSRSAGFTVKAVWLGMPGKRNLTRLNRYKLLATLKERFVNNCQDATEQSISWDQSGECILVSAVLETQRCIYIKWERYKKWENLHHIQQSKHHVLHINLRLQHYIKWPASPALRLRSLRFDISTRSPDAGRMLTHAGC